MAILVYFFVFILGTLIGSFLNVVVLRYNSGQGIVRERSACFSCSKTLEWFELIPIISFLMQGGRCRNCKSKISWQYITVEILTGLIFLFVFLKRVPNIFAFYTHTYLFLYPLLFSWIIFSLLIAIAVYDIRHKIIPDALVYSFIILSFLGMFVESYTQNIFSHSIAAFLIALPFFLLWFLSRGRAMGFGDVKLAVGMGVFLGLARGIYALLWAFWIGGLVSVFLLLFGPLSEYFVHRRKLRVGYKRFTIKSEIPFGPFLVLGLALAYFWNWDFIHLDLLFSFF